LVVFTADNGGETTRGASNYPLRGTKGEPYEGNTRVITALSGGVIESQNLIGQVREDIVSNLDWTPTLLDFAGYLECIDEVDYTWDGHSQYDMIMGTQSSEDRRTSLVINIGDDELRSARIMIEREGTYYKYIRSDSTSAIDRWSYSPMFTDSWSAWADDGVSLVRDLYDESDLESEYRWSQAVDDCLLFDVSNDESERYNLLDSNIPHFDADLNEVLVEKSVGLLREWVDEHAKELFAAPIAFLHERLAIGDPKLVEDGRFVRPFLSNAQYLHMIKNMFANEANKGNDLPQPLQDLYTNEWVVPTTKTTTKGMNNYVAPAINELRPGVPTIHREQELAVKVKTFKVMEEEHPQLTWSVIFGLVFAALMVVSAVCVIARYHCRKQRKKSSDGARGMERGSLTSLYQTF